MAKAEPDFLSDDELERRPSVVLPQLEEQEKQFFDIVATGDVSEVRNFLDGLSDFNINCVNFQAERQFFATVHGKRHRNGLGGTTKRPARRTSLQLGIRQHILQAQEPFEPGRYNSKYINFVDCTTSDYQKYQTILEPRFIKVAKIKATQLSIMWLQGITALHVAVQGRNLQMIELLLSRPGIEVNDTALYAVRENELQIVVMILDHMQRLEFAGAMHSSDFLDETTPLGVAAYYGHFELIRLLLDRGHELNRPHPPSCYCEKICKPQRATEDALIMDKMRLFLYTAIANPAYICLTKDDPILEAFVLAVELSAAARHQHEFYAPYQKLSETVARFATELIECARTTEEVEIILRQSSELHLSTKFTYPRLLLALDWKMKTFVANANIQQLIEFKWQDNWYEWKLRSAILKVLSVPSRILMLPIIVFWILLAPNSSRAKHWSIPVNKFVSFTASYLVFLFFVYSESNIDKTNQLRGPPDSGFEIILVIYVVAYIWGSSRLCMIHGPKRFFKTPWKWFEVIMLLLFSITFLFWGVAMVDVKHNGQRDLERKYWHQYDPTLIAEGTFCIATIMAFFKLLLICQLDPDLGPLQISLGKMIKDVTRFIIIFTIIILAFSAGLARFYQYYQGMTQVDDETKLKTQQTDSFVNFPSTLKTLFWAIFCMSPIESADVVIENLPGETEVETIINEHEFTETVGYIAFAAFEFISVIVTLNMLIACMSNTFTTVTENVSVEWMFGRSEIYVEFMTQTTLPAPFNLIPTAAAFNDVAEFIKALVSPTSEKKARWSLNHCCYVENIEVDGKQDFPIVMSQLVQRYFRKKETKSEETEVNPLQKELVELRTLLREALSPA